MDAQLVSLRLTFNIIGHYCMESYGLQITGNHCCNYGIYNAMSKTTQLAFMGEIDMLCQCTISSHP